MKPELPRYEAGCRMPSSHSISMADEARKAEAEKANDRFLAALAQYFRRGGKA